MSDILNQTLATVLQLKADAQRALPFPMKTPPDRVAIERPGGVVDVVPVPRPARVESAGTPDSLVALARRLGGEVRVYVALGTVLAFRSGDDERRDTVRLPLPLSAPFAGLMKWAESGWKGGQEQLVRLLRTTLAGSFAPASLLPTVRSLKFRQASDGSSEIQHGRQSMGKSIEASVSGANELPDEVTFRVPVWDLDDEDAYIATVRCAFDVSVSDGVFVLTPLPGELARATREAVDHMADLIIQADDAAASEDIPRLDIVSHASY